MALIPLTKGYFTRVDDIDYEGLAREKWHVQIDRHSAYAMRSVREQGRQKHIWMHREILGTPKGQFTDHISGDTLDNRRANLRVATAAQNAQNSRRRNKYGFKGIRRRTESTSIKKFRAQIYKDGRTYTSCGFKTADEAAKEYDAMATVLFGRFARVNFPNGKIDGAALARAKATLVEAA